MHAHQAEAMVARLTMLMDNRDIGDKHCAMYAMHTSGDIDILGIKEETLIEILNRRASILIGNLFESRTTEKQETAHHIWHIHLAGIARESERVAFTLMSKPRMRQKTPDEKVERRGQQPTYMLNRAIGIEGARNTLTNIRMALHIVEQKFNSSWFESHIAIDDQMIFRRTLTDSFVMSCSIANIINTIIDDYNRRDERRLPQTRDAAVEFALWRMVCDNRNRNHN